MAVKRGGEGGRREGLRESRQALEQAVAELPRLVAIWGECDFLRAEAAARLRRAWLEKFPGGDTATIRGQGEGRPVGTPDILRELSGGSLFAREKLVLVRQAERLLFPTRGGAGGEEGAGADAAPADRDKAFLDGLERQPAATWLFLESAQLPKNRTLGKRLAAAAFLIPCPEPTQREIPGWLAERAAGLGKRLDDAAVDLLVRAHGADPGVLAGELEKLALFAGEAADIGAGVVGEFLTGRIEFDIFGFTNAVEARDRRQAVMYARRIALQGTRDQRGKREDGERSAHKALSMLAGTVQGLVRARVALARRLPAADFAAEERLSPWRAEKLLEAARRFELPELRKMLGAAAEQLRRAHDTGGDALLALETLAVRLTAK